MPVPAPDKRSLSEINVNPCPLPGVAAQHFPRSTLRCILYACEGAPPRPDGEQEPYAFPRRSRRNRAVCWPGVAACASSRQYGAVSGRPSAQQVGQTRPMRVVCHFRVRRRSRLQSVQVTKLSGSVATIVSLSGATTATSAARWRPQGDRPPRAPAMPGAAPPAPPGCAPAPTTSPPPARQYSCREVPPDGAGYREKKDWTRSSFPVVGRSAQIVGHQ